MAYNLGENRSECLQELYGDGCICRATPQTAAVFLTVSSTPSYSFDPNVENWDEKGEGGR